MTSLVQPVVGEWYKLPDAETFRVTAIDSDYVEIQYPDGAIESLEKVAWRQLKAAPMEPSEDWLKAIDDDLRELSFLTLDVTSGVETQDFQDLYGEIDFST